MTRKKIDYTEIEHNQWFKEAEFGNAKAQYELGMRFFNGDGVEKSEKEAVKWWRQAAEKENAAAQYMLGFCYEKGYGVEQNKAEAVKLYRKAARKGDEDAKDALKRLGE